MLPVPMSCLAAPTAAPASMLWAGWSPSTSACRRTCPGRGRTSITGVFKDPVSGRRRVGKLNVDGDGQGDLAGHGGEQRAVFVYQIESYRYWERELGRDDFVYGQFGENFTVEGLGDDEVCIGDRYRIGTAHFEVTQPRVTCYRVGIRMNDPRIPALLVSHHRPGFYFRVLEEGEVQAGDEIIKLASGPEQMPVAEVDALLYLPGHPRQATAASAADSCPQPGLAGLVPSSARGRTRWRQRRACGDEPAAGLAGLPSADRHCDHPRERVGDLDTPRGPRRAHHYRPPARASTSRCGSSPTTEQRSLLRNYSLSGPPDGGYYRVSVKREHDGAASGYLHTPARRRRPARRRSAAWHLHPRRARDAPVLLISAGIGATPVLAMLQALAAGAVRSGDLVAARRTQPSRALVRRRGPRRSSPRSRTYARHVYYSRPGSGRPSKAETSTAWAVSPDRCSPGLEPPRDAEAYLCGPAPFMDEISAGLAALGIDAPRIHTEPFGPAPGLTPGIAARTCADSTPTRRPAWKRRDDRVRPQQPGDPMERRATRACSNSPRHATYLSDGPAAPASAIPVRQRSSPARSGTAPSRSNLPLMEAHSSAARSRATTSCSTCERQLRPQPRVGRPPRQRGKPYPKAVSSSSCRRS